MQPNELTELEKLTTTRSIPTTTIIPTIFNNTTSSPTTIVSTLSMTSIPTYITTIGNTNNSVHNSKESSSFSYFPTLIKQQNELTELEKLKHNFNPNTTISIPTNTFSTFNITNPNTTNTMIAPIYTTNTFTTPTLTSTICTHTTTTTHPTMNNTNISVQGTNQYPTISNFTIPIKQQIQPNNNNQVFFPKHLTHIEMTNLHFDRTYNQPSVPQQLPRESNQLPLVPQINSQVLSSTHPQEPQHNSRKRKNNNQMGLEGHVIEEKVKEDSWTWIKYGQKPINGSPHPRSYYKCNSFSDCPARKMVQKSKTKNNTYVVTYKSDHDHIKPAGNLNSMIGTSLNKSSETRLPATREPGSSSNVGNFHLPNVAVLQFDQPESSNVSNFRSPNVMMLQFDQLESNNGQIFADESDKKITGSLDDDDDAILLEKMKTMLENFLVDFKHIMALIPLD
ncbi:unnamed protein product [Trifolium pratense]|uniref:Uncharacterized protein n=1 Tax=Trifolium pratense TaxID=57577 RepID=A0ACB0LAS2_TRIPR|nr:unnamed protein product [Trifolium pratense]